MLLSARVVVALIPFGFWRGRLGAAGARKPNDALRLRGEQLAGDVEWAASRIPFTVRCLPKAIALSWMLRRDRIAHSVVFAVRPLEVRHGRNSLHAWVEVGGNKIIGDLEGPWMETLRLGNKS